MADDMFHREPRPELMFAAAPPAPKRNHAVTAALIGGAAAAAAGAVLGARALARRNGAGPGKPLNPIMETACTAGEVNGRLGEPRAPREPAFAQEPKVGTLLGNDA